MNNAPETRPFASLIRLVDRLEARADGYLTLDALTNAGAPQSVVREAIEGQIILVDFRHRLSTPGNVFEPVTLCRLNRHHPWVREAAGD